MNHSLNSVGREVLPALEAGQPSGIGLFRAKDER